MEAFDENSEQWFLIDRPGDPLADQSKIRYSFQQLPQLLETVSGLVIDCGILFCVGSKLGWGWNNVIICIAIKLCSTSSYQAPAGVNARFGAGLIQTDHIWRWSQWCSLWFVSWTAGHDALVPGRTTKELEWITFKLIIPFHE